jgi:hypothetical protein
VIPTGLNASDDYNAVYATAHAILSGFQNDLGANTVRLPINPPTVSGWWGSYKGTVDAATDLGMKVILSYWDQHNPGSGKIDGNINDYWSMWSSVVGTYVGSPNVYFEPMNEPWGYSAGEWESIAESWLKNFPNVPRNRVLISGTGCNHDVTTVGGDPNLAGTLLSLHFYDWRCSGDKDQRPLSALIGTYADRTVVDEYGAEMVNGDSGLVNYADPTIAPNPDSSEKVSYLKGLTNYLHDNGIGSVYWPGLKGCDGSGTCDPYSLETLFNDSQTTVVNPFGVALVQHAWS